MMSSLIKFVRTFELELRLRCSVRADGTDRGEVVADVLLAIADAVAAAAKATLLA